MSLAGIRSNRGDGYQTLVAFDWALTVLSDENYQWLEIDSITWAVAGAECNTVIELKPEHHAALPWNFA